MPKRILLHPLAKRLVLAVAIVVGIGIVRAWFGEHSPLIAVLTLTGTGSYIFADWLLSRKSEGEVRIRHVAEFFRSRRTMAATWAMYVLLIGYFFGSLAEPQTPAVRQLLFLAQTLGLVAVLIVPIAY